MVTLKLQCDRIRNVLRIRVTVGRDRYRAAFSLGAQALQSGKSTESVVMFPDNQACRTKRGLIVSLNHKLHPRMTSGLRILQILDVDGTIIAIAGLDREPKPRCRAVSAGK